MFEYKNIFKSEDGAELEMTIKADCSTQEEMHKTVSFIAQSARKFYLQTAEKINREVTKRKNEKQAAEYIRRLANEEIT